MINYKWSQLFEYVNKKMYFNPLVIARWNFGPAVVLRIVVLDFKGMRDQRIREAVMSFFIILVRGRCFKLSTKKTSGYMEFNPLYITRNRT